VVSLLTTRMRVPAGSPVVWNGYPDSNTERMAVVMMPGPVPSSVWALEFGSWLCLKWNGHRQVWMDITREHPVADQRACVVNAMVEVELRLRPRRYAFVPDSEHYRARPGESDHAWSIRARRIELDHDLAVLAQLRARFWQELYGVTQTD